MSLEKDPNFPVDFSSKAPEFWLVFQTVVITCSSGVCSNLILFLSCARCISLDRNSRVTKNSFPEIKRQTSPKKSTRKWSKTYCGPTFNEEKHYSKLFRYCFWTDACFDRAKYALFLSTLKLRIFVELDYIFCHIFFNETMFEVYT